MYDFSPFSVFEIQMHLAADWAEVIGHRLTWVCEKLVKTVIPFISSIELCA